MLLTFDMMYGTMSLRNQGGKQNGIAKVCYVLSACLHQSGE